MANLKLFCFVAIVLVYSASAKNNRKFLKKLNDELKALENLEKQEPLPEVQPVKQEPLPEVQPVNQEPLPEVQPVNQEPLPEVQPVKQGPLPEVQPGKSGPRPFSASHAHGRNHPLLEYLAKNHVNLNKAGRNHAKQVESRWLCSWFGWFCDEEDDYDYDYDDDDSTATSTGTSTGSSTGSSTSSTSSTNQCKTYSKCGDPYASKIVNGAEVAIAARPWQIYLYTGSTMCGGSILSESYILTAAHCIHGLQASQLSVYAGHQYSPTSTYIPVTSEVSEIMEHESYNTGTYDNDIAILKLSTALTFGNGIQPICMPGSDEPTADTVCTVSGWGTTSSGGSTSPTLLEVSVPIMSGCGAMSITEHMVCAGYISGGADSCQGDSGGPLACNTGGAYYQWGVVSFGHGCALPNYPGVYAKVSSYMSSNWIYQKTGGECYTR